MLNAATSPSQNVFPSLPHHVADQAGLFVTFYGQKGKLNPLVELFRNRFSLKPRPGHENFWEDLTPGKEISLALFEKPSGFAHDTAIVQLVLNEPGEASTAWGCMQTRLEQTGFQEELDNLHDQGFFWGYTRVYEAIKKDPSFDFTNFLAQAEVMNGHLWLLAIPMGEEGIKAAMDYVALVPEDQNNPLVTEVLCGPGAALLAPDLIAHKGYYHIRQYRVGGYKEFYEGQAKLLREALPSLMNDVSIDSKKMIKTSRLVYLSIPLFDTIRVAISQQLYNYNLAQESNTLLKNGDLLSYHYGQLKTAFDEIKLLADFGRSTTDVVRIEIERANEESNQNRDFLLNIIAIVFAIPQFISSDIACRILLWSKKLPLVLYSYIQLLHLEIAECEGSSSLRPFVFQAIIVIWLLSPMLLSWLNRKYIGFGISPQ